MRRGVGVSAVTKKATEKKQYEAIGKKMDETRISNVKETLNKFQIALSEFAEKHRGMILRYKRSMFFCLSILPDRGNLDSRITNICYQYASVYSV